MGETGTASGGPPWRGSAAFGARVGVSEGRVRQLVRKGMPRDKDGQVSIFTAESLAWYEANCGPAARPGGKGGPRPGAGRPPRKDVDALVGAGGDEAIRVTLEDGSTVDTTAGEARAVVEAESLTPESLRSKDLTEIEKIYRASRAYTAWIEAQEADGRVVAVEAATGEWAGACAEVARSLRDGMRTVVDELVNAGLVDAGDSARALSIADAQLDESLRRLATETFGPREVMGDG